MTALRDALANASGPRKPRRQEEHDLQTAAVALLELILPPDAIVTSIDHANAASKIAGALRKRRGVKAGIPDVWVIWATPAARRQPIVVVLETKAPKGRLSTGQEMWRDSLRPLGVHWAAPRTLEEIVAAVAAAGIPVRKHAL